MISPNLCLILFRWTDFTLWIFDLSWYTIYIDRIDSFNGIIPHRPYNCNVHDHLVQTSYIGPGPGQLPKKGKPTRALTPNVKKLETNPYIEVGEIFRSLPDGSTCYGQLNSAI